MENVFYWTGLIVWIFVGGAWLLALISIASWWAFDIVVRRIGMYSHLVDAIWNRAKYLNKEKEKE